MKKFIFIPVVNNFDLLEKAVRSVKPNLFDEYIIFNNSGEHIPDNVYSNTSFRVFTPDSSHTFTETQNAMRQYAINNKYDYYCFMHNDGEILDDTDIKLINHIESLDKQWGVVFTYYDVFCAFNTNAVKFIGPWSDPSWPPQKSGYYLDNDYYRRLSLAGYEKIDIEGDGVSHVSSATIKNEIESQIWKSQVDNVHKHYIRKWGGSNNGEERFDHAFNKIPKSIVTGGAGFIGSHIVDKLIDLGHEVICIDNESAVSNEQFYWNAKATNYKYDICDYDTISTLFKDIDYVFHLASDARIQLAIQNPRQSMNTNAVGTFNVLEASRANKVKRVIYSSTSSSYGKKNTIPNIESQKPDPLTTYSSAKIFGENLMRVYFNLYGLETVSLRYFNVYGDRQPIKGQYAPVIGLFLKQHSESLPLTIVGDGTQRRDFTHISDVVDANIRAAVTYNEDIFGETYNIGTNINNSILDIAKTISADVKYIDARPGEVNETMADNSKAKYDLDWSPKINLMEWIKKI